MMMWNFFLVVFMIHGNLGCEFCDINSAEYDSTVRIDSHTTIKKSKLTNDSHVSLFVTIGYGNVLNNANIHGYAKIQDGNKLFLTTIGTFSTISSNNVINQSKIDRHVTMKDRNVLNETHVGTFSTISSNNVITQSEIARHVTMKDRNILNHANVGTFTTIGSHNQIHPGSKIGGHVKIDDGVKINVNSEIMTFSKIGRNVQIGENCIVDAHSSIDSEAFLGKKAYVGVFAHCGSGQRLGEWVIIENFASLVAVKNPEKYSVVIEKPTSKYLYSMSVAIGDFDITKISAALMVGTSSFSDKRFNDMLHNMMKQQSDEWLKNCKDAKLSTKLLHEIISLYLFARDRRNKFNKERKSFDGVQMVTNDQNDHFSAKTANEILTDSTKDSFRKLLAIYQDKNRPSRVKDDEFCKFVQQVLNGKRKVLIDGTTRSHIPPNSNDKNNDNGGSTNIP